MVATNLDRAALQVPTQYFLDHVLPPLRSELNPEEALAKIKCLVRTTARAITKAGRWWGFSQEPALANCCEEISFQNFPRITEAIAKYGVSRGVTPCFKLLHNPKRGVKTSDRDDHSFPDAFMVPPRTCQGEVKWSDIGVVGEYKKKRDAFSVRDVSCSVLRIFVSVI